jgi:TDG/mug DNA glycosylase family protein
MTFRRSIAISSVSWSDRGSGKRSLRRGLARVHAHSFPAISDASSRVLILGSMPGKASLRAQQYYAHPQNLFWKIIAGLFEIDAASRYETRVARLVEEGVALWDVIQTCTRESSLDSDIDESSIVANDFASFYRDHAAIRRVYFNGAKAEATYRKHVLPSLSEGLVHSYQRLPSTSPANASIPYVTKIEAWGALRG